MTDTQVTWLTQEAYDRLKAELDQLIANRPQDLVRNPRGAYALYRIGDAVASRNIHAAVYDALRLAKDL